MAREVVIAAVQLPDSQHGEASAEVRECQIRTAEEWLRKAGQQGADIACLGEMFNVRGLSLTPQNLVSEIKGALETTLTRLGAVAQRHNMYIVAPILGLVEGIPRNIALLLDRQGNWIGSYIKVHCTEEERRLGLVPGDEWPVFNLDFGRIGIHICHDNSFLESSRCLTLNGAEIIFWPHVMSGWGGELMDVMLRSPSIYNGIYHVPVCYGCPRSRAWRPGMLIGRSSIIAPDGSVVADAGRHPGIALTRIDLDARRIAGDFTRKGDYIWQVDMLNDRRPETYAPIVRPTSPLPPIPPFAEENTCGKET